MLQGRIVLQVQHTQHMLNVRLCVLGMSLVVIGALPNLLCLVKRRQSPSPSPCTCQKKSRETRPPSQLCIVPTGEKPRFIGMAILSVDNKEREAVDVVHGFSIEIVGLQSTRTCTYVFFYIIPYHVQCLTSIRILYISTRSQFLLVAMSLQTPISCR